MNTDRPSLSFERKNVLFRILQLDNPLYFRMEMILFLVCFLACLIQMMSGILSHEFKDSQDDTAQYFLVLQCIFETIYSAIYVFIFGGFALVILLRFKTKKRSIATSDELFEQTELIETLQDQSGFELFEEYSKKEFSLENLYLFLELIQNKSIVMGDNLSLLPMFMDRINENFICSGSIYEVNVPSLTKNLFTELHFYVSSKRSALLSCNQALFSPVNEPTSPENQFNALLFGNELHKQLDGLNEEEERILKARIITCFDSLSQQIMINMNDTFYRFISTSSFKNYRKNKEMFTSMAKQTNIMAWQDDAYIV
ncbi:predicted protein [Naegleria gruberi]|uniref:Predicted protein n=1 Tax=Naegleria gruberi TaxID=5762 RepID=D2VLF9_NAEGR|nr:uncharacterized protein NAEGRDRAFT_69765 [Naegleria gruberi]EFC42378.1 predicted protein [Naegleria gruberi]|eukprot:XP_002675122.1 predicted protein [Naegleria gruberi strain NEG-M]